MECELYPIAPVLLERDTATIWRTPLLLAPASALSRECDFKVRAGVRQTHLKNLTIPALKFSRDLVQSTSSSQLPHHDGFLSFFGGNPIGHLTEI